MKQNEVKEKKDRDALVRKLLLEVRSEQIYIPRVGEQGVYIEPLNHVNTPRGIVLKPGSGMSA
jgi:hypothetical protein